MGPYHLKANFFTFVFKTNTPPLEDKYVIFSASIWWTTHAYIYTSIIVLTQLIIGLSYQNLSLSFFFVRPNLNIYGHGASTLAHRPQHFPYRKKRWFLDNWINIREMLSIYIHWGPHMIHPCKKFTNSPYIHNLIHTPQNFRKEYI